MEPLKALSKIFGRLQSNSKQSHPDPASHPLNEVFDAAHYLAQLPPQQAALARRAPLTHYLTTGWHENHNPHPVFDVAWYLNHNPDVAAAGVEPFGHYVSSGWKEGRCPRSDFDSNDYLSRHPKLLIAHTCPLALLNHCYHSTTSRQRTPDAELPSASHWPSHYPSSRPYPYLQPEVMKERVSAYRKSKGRSNKTAFFTCITGGYDILRLPEVLSHDIDYFLFTDRPADGYGVFQVCRIQSQENDPTRAARHVKLHPHHYLKDYDLAVWFDANLILRNDFTPLITRFIASEQPLAFLPNTIFNCLYKDAVFCAQSGRDKVEKIVPQMLAYQRAGFPPNHGLIESNLFAVRLQRPEVQAFFDAWWAELSQGSRRDQLSANYVLWKQGLTYMPFLGEGENTRTHPSVALLTHGTYDAAHFASLISHPSPS